MYAARSWLGINTVPKENNKLPLRPNNLPGEWKMHFLETKKIKNNFKEEKKAEVKTKLRSDWCFSLTIKINN